MEHITGQSVSLQSLPFEIQYFIIQSLDPIAIVSLSQTGRFYRQLINPGRSQQIERLLALECLAEYGGDRPAILHPDSDEAVAGPDWHRDAWPEHHRWACACCLRLLPHIHFSNHFLLRRQYRKPGLGSPEAAPLTSWEPGLGRRAGQNGRHRDSQQLGWARGRRKCNECMFQRGELGHTVQRWLGYPHGTPEVPIQISRRLAFKTLLDRYFPGLEASLESGPRPFPLRNRSISRADVFEETWTMYMVRCPGCEHWQEQRAFRFGGLSKHWKPMLDEDRQLRRYREPQTEPPIRVMLDEVRCNRCFVRENGRDALGRKLLRFLRTMIGELLHQAETQLIRGWSSVRQNHFPEEYTKEVQKMLEKVDLEERDWYEGGQNLECMSDSCVATWRMLHEEFKTLWTSMRTHADFVEEDFLEDAHFMAWLNCYHETEASWLWLREVRCEAERNPDILVAWALGRDDGASLM
ncbi:unnamed protein product [Clonostachys solani]|uniref:F-box domain-containing protein n=1 Tax=Clonostachys solani TaxID=160281 RepID=A0A9N9W1T8_9HYPO|nr:unnamed protein product [Clonostachys solani]